MKKLLTLLEPSEAPLKTKYQMDCPECGNVVAVLHTKRRGYHINPHRNSRRLNARGGAAICLNSAATVVKPGSVDVPVDSLEEVKMPAFVGVWDFLKYLWLCLKTSAS